MNRRSAASLIAVGLLAVLVIVAARMSVPYVLISPGPTINVLGDNGGKPIVQVKGHKTYPADGELRLTTVSVTNPETRLTLVDALWGWMRSDKEVMPVEAMYPKDSSAEQEQAQSAAQMVSSQDTATAVALSELGYKLPTHVEVTGVTPGGPSDGKLEPRDVVSAVNGTEIKDMNGLLGTLGAVQPGDPVEVVVRRDGEDRTFQITTTASEDDKNRAVIGVLVGIGYDFPFDVRVRIDDSIGGPSAGLIFALSVYDTLTPGSLTGGDVIAGTGTISPDGKVGPIGGIREKIIAAAQAGAQLFFVPPANCASAEKAPIDDTDLRLVRADTMHSAVTSLQKYADDPNADLPRCPT